MKTMVIGNGGREHALIWKLAQSPLIDGVYCCPGNGGTAAVATNLDREIDANDLNALADFAAAQRIDLTVVGPEAYLARGMVDLFQKRGLPVYGTTQAAARLESSKAFAKEFMQKYRIPTAAFATFDNPGEAKAHLREQEAPWVVKADGLAAGKGVIIAADLAAADQAVDQIMTERVFGASGARVVIEEFLSGEEVSLLAFCDGTIAVPMIPVQDHKRIGAGDTGPNTGGMGTYAPTTVFTPEISRRVTAEILEPTLRGMRAEGCPFTGTLFLGLMLTADGPKVIEYNARFGDPETQVVLPLLETDLARIMTAAIAGRLKPDLVQWRPETAVCVVAASGGYPGPYETGKTIHGLASIRDSLVFHAGTRLGEDGVVRTAGGRVLNVVHLGHNIKEACAGAYSDLERIRFDGMYFRPDIGWRELKRQEGK